MEWVAAGAAVASWLNSEQGRRASARERKKMQDLLSSLQDPNFDASQIDFPTFKILQRYVPQVSQYVEEKNPQLVELSAQAQEGLDAQLAALRRLREAGSAEGDIAQTAAINEAARKAAIANRGMQGQIMESFRRRGMGGSGLELAAALSGQQGAAETAGLTSEAAAVDAYKNRLAALARSGELGGQVKREETDLAARNADILNNFNMRSAANRNAYNQYADRTANEASKYNIGEGQRVYEKNLGGRYDNDVRMQEMRNDLAQSKFNNDLSKITGQQWMYGQNQGAIDNRTRDYQNIIAGLGNAAASKYYYDRDAEEREKDRQAYGSGYASASNQNRGTIYDYDSGRRRSDIALS